MAQVNISHNLNISEIDFQIPYEVLVTCEEGATWTVAIEDVKVNNNSNPDAIKVNKVDDTKYTITGEVMNAQGTIKVTGTKSGSDTKVISNIIKIILIPTKLTVTYNQQEIITAGKFITFVVNTNATEYSLVSSDTDVLKYTEQQNKLEAVNKGRCVVTVEARKKYSELKSFSTIIEVVKTQPPLVSTDITSIELYNAINKCSVKLQHISDTNSNDVVLTLPKENGTLLSNVDESIPDNYIDTPFIVSPSNMTKNYTGGFIDSKFYTTKENYAKRYESEWQVSHDADFTKIEYEVTVKREFESFATINVEPVKLHFAGIGVFYVRVRHNAFVDNDILSSKWSSTVVVQFGTDYEDKDLPEPIWWYKPDEEDTDIEPEIPNFPNYWWLSYYGTVGMDKLVDDYDFRGTFNTIVNSYHKEYYGDVNATWDRLIPVTFKKGYQVLHNNKLWYALKDVVVEDKEKTNLVPGGYGSEDNWKEDDRDNLPTPRLLLKMMGLQPNNLTYDVLRTFSHKPNEMPEQTGYFKYIYNGQLCFTTIKPILNGASYGQFAIRYATDGRRVLRIGKKLYRVRLMTSNEYIALFTTLTTHRINGVHYNPVDDLNLDKISICTNEYNLSRTDKQYNNNIYYNKFDIANNKLVCLNKGEDSTADAVTGSIMQLADNNKFTARLVLEYVPEDLAAHNNLDLMWPKRVKSKNDVLAYDKYTNTGFLGIIEANELFTTDEIWTSLGLNYGKTNCSKWYIFYYQGILFYFANSKQGHYDNGTKILEAEGYPTNKRWTGSCCHTMTKDGIVYYIAQLPIMSDITPLLKNTPTPSNYTNYYNPVMMFQNVYDNGILNLMYRAVEGYVGYDNPNKFSNPSQWSGHQKGDNWEHPDLTEETRTWINIGLGKLSNGKYIYGNNAFERYHSYPSLDNNNPISPCTCFINCNIFNHYSQDVIDNSAWFSYPFIPHNPYVKLNNKPINSLVNNYKYPVLRFDVLNPEKRALIFRKSNIGVAYNECRIPITEAEHQKIHETMTANLKKFGFNLNVDGYQSLVGSSISELNLDSTWILVKRDMFETLIKAREYSTNKKEWVRNVNFKLDLLFRQTNEEYELYTKDNSNHADLINNVNSMVRTPTEIVYYAMKDILPYSKWVIYQNDSIGSRLKDDEEFKQELITKYKIQPHDINYVNDLYNLNYIRYLHTLNVDDFDTWVDLATMYLIDAAYTYDRIMISNEGTYTCEIARRVDNQDINKSYTTTLTAPTYCYFKHFIDLWWNKFIIM